MNPRREAQYDAAVIGAGPAGALAAYLLARRGLSVVLIERAKLPRHKVCGGCLNARGASVLAAAGLAHIPSQALAQPLHEVAFHRGLRSVAIRASMGAAIDRAAFDAALTAAAQNSGATLVDSATAVVLDDFHPDHRIIQLRQGPAVVEQLAARLVVAADGLGHPSLAHLPEFHSAVAPHSRVGLGVIANSGWHAQGLPQGVVQLKSTRAPATPREDLGVPPDGYPAGVLHMAVADGGYLGVTRLASGAFCIAAAVDRAVLQQRTHVGSWLNETLASCGLPEIAGLNESPIKGTPLLTRRTSRIAGHRILVVGDAAGYIEPITGEGMTWALVGAAALDSFAPAAANHWSAETESAWQRTLQAAVTRRQTVNRILAATLRSPTCSRLLFAAAAACPAAVAPVARYLNQPLTNQPFTRPPLAHARSAA